MFLLILLSMLVAGGFLSLFVWAANTGQYDDVVSPSVKMMEEPVKEIQVNEVGHKA